MFVFAHGWVTSMSLGGGGMSVDGAHSLTHSILINLFIKSGLNNFLLPPQPSIVFVQGCSV